MTTDTSELGLEALIVKHMTTQVDGWTQGEPTDYEREYAVDLVQPSTFVHGTQQDTAEAVSIASDGPARRSVLARLQGEITKRGVVDVLRNGIKHGPHHIDLFYGS